MISSSDAHVAPRRPEVLNNVSGAPPLSATFLTV